jgi:hypothetical protein
MLKRAESFGMSKLVRKLSVEGRAIEKSGSGSGSGSFFLDDFRLKTGVAVCAGPFCKSSKASLAFSFSFLFLRNRFIVGSCYGYAKEWLQSSRGLAKDEGCTKGVTLAVASRQFTQIRIESPVLDTHRGLRRKRAA